jgi:hypothetical protein
MNQWMDPEQREKLRKKQEEIEQAKADKKKKTKISFDFAGRKVLVAEGLLTSQCH